MSVPVYQRDGVGALPASSVHQDSAFATEILPGPPTLAAENSADLKKLFVSHLPATDPGTSYSGISAGTVLGAVPTVIPIETEGPRPKRARAGAGSSQIRVQRAPARALASTSTALADAVALDDTLVPSTLTSAPEQDPTLMATEEDGPQASTSTLPEDKDYTERTRGRDKGKEKETDRVIKMKDEPLITSSMSPAPQLSSIVQNNQDHCSACRSHGSLLYCDNCPRAFHMWCLNPPMEQQDVPPGSWYCPVCEVQKNPVPAPSGRAAPRNFMTPLINLASQAIPREYELPDEIRLFYKDVGVGVRGQYVDTSEIKQLRLNRYGQLEERDPHRLKDRNGAPVLCFQCNTSALPSNLTPSHAPTKRPRQASTHDTGKDGDAWKPIISCDYCTLHWHLDCLDKPLCTMPSTGKKWMCPSHVEHTLPPKKRIPKANAVPVDITKAGQFNNGNIDVVPSKPLVASQKVKVDDVMINGRRYRIPERVILLDFWNKINKDRNGEQSDQSMRDASPLTSLSSLDERMEGSNEMELAQLLVSLRTGNFHDEPDKPFERLSSPIEVPSVPESSLGPTSEPMSEDSLSLETASTLIPQSITTEIVAARKATPERRPAPPVSSRSTRSVSASAVVTPAETRSTPPLSTSRASRLAARHATNSAILKIPRRPILGDDDSEATMSDSAGGEQDKTYRPPTRVPKRIKLTTSTTANEVGGRAKTPPPPQGPPQQAATPSFKIRLPGLKGLAAVRNGTSNEVG